MTAKVLVERHVALAMETEHRQGGLEGSGHGWWRCCHESPLHSPRPRVWACACMGGRTAQARPVRLSFGASFVLAGVCAERRLTARHARSTPNRPAVSVPCAAHPPPTRLTRRLLEQLFPDRILRCLAEELLAQDIWDAEQQRMESQEQQQQQQQGEAAEGGGAGPGEGEVAGSGRSTAAGAAGAAGAGPGAGGARRSPARRRRRRYSIHVSPQMLQLRTALATQHPQVGSLALLRSCMVLVAWCTCVLTRLRAADRRLPHRMSGREHLVEAPGVHAKAPVVAGFASGTAARLLVYRMRVRGQQQGCRSAADCMPSGSQHALALVPCGRSARPLPSPSYRNDSALPRAALPCGALPRAQVTVLVADIKGEGGMGG